MRRSDSYVVAALWCLVVATGCGRSSFIFDDGRAPAPVPGWTELANTQLQSACPPDHFNGDAELFSRACQYVVRDSSGAIADTARNRLVVWGGGGYYHGNELYALNLTSDPPDLVRLNDPTTPTNAGDNSCIEELPEGGSGYPASRATYNGLIYLAHADRLLAVGGVLSTCDSAALWSLDLKTLAWSRMDPVVGAPINSGAGLGAAYDPLSQTVFIHDISNLWQYTFETNSSALLARDLAFDYHLTSVVDPGRRLLVSAGCRSCAWGGLLVISIASGSNYAVQDWTATTTGCDPLLDAVNPGLVYDPVRDRVVGWPDFGGSVYALNLDTRTCEELKFPGGPTDSDHLEEGTANTTGTFGRFNFFPELGLYAVVNDWNLNAFTLRLP